MLGHSLGWTRNETSQTLRAAPLPQRVRARQAHGISVDEHAQQTRALCLRPERRHELDELVRRLRAELVRDERPYVIDQVRQPERQGRPGRPDATEQERRQ